MFWYDGQLFLDDESDDEALSINCSALLTDVLLGEGLRFGSSVFTTMRVYGQSLEHPMTQWQGHCDRITHSLTQFGWPIPNWTSIHKGCQALKNIYPVLRIAVFPTGKSLITGRALPPQLGQRRQLGISAWLAPTDYARSLPTHKTGNYLACSLARQQAQTLGADEAILAAASGDWLETATGNLWGWADGQWWTPLGNRCLPGLMRKKLCQLLQKKGQAVNGEAWTPAAVKRFDAIAYSNCVVQLLPIHTIFNEHTKLEYNAQHASLKALQQLLFYESASVDDS
ncbi:MAG: aminotransferase class IV [Cyanobacteria bacterium J06554_3]